MIAKVLSAAGAGARSHDSLERKEMPEAIVALSERLSERSNRVMGELAELGAVRPRLLADDAVELRP